MDDDDDDDEGMWTKKTFIFFIFELIIDNH